MEQTEKETVRAASVEVSREFKTLINAEDLDSLKQLQHLMYISLFIDYNMFVELTSKHYQNWILLLVLLIMLLSNLYWFSENEKNCRKRFCLIIVCLTWPWLWLIVENYVGNQEPVIIKYQTLQRAHEPCSFKKEVSIQSKNIVGFLLSEGSKTNLYS